ncbi:unnamed protein product [Prorocentrum cordatum]|uniref:Uncharacterized protein n=1 Tax=Prorocentrum cordatum TaxID=2364126 RepID=A0ABN9RU22_9DINO|nr:unnamed protein product [Polarella glacialis]
MAHERTLYTIDVGVQMIGVRVGGKVQRDAGLRFTLADAATLQPGQPRLAQRHALSTVTQRAREQLTFPETPRNVDYMNHGLMPPQSEANPYKGRSWACCVDVVPMASSAIKAAIAHGTAHATFVLKRAFFEADLAVPASPTAAAWTASASLLGQRLNIHRTGTRADAADWAVSDLIRFRPRLDPALPTNVRQEFDALANKHSAYITIGPFNWEGDAEAVTAPKRRPTAADGERVARKRPARR